MNIIGNIEDKNCIIIDDMIDTAGTICNAANAIKYLGARSVRAAATSGRSRWFDISAGGSSES